MCQNHYIVIHDVCESRETRNLQWKKKSVCASVRACVSECVYVCACVSECVYVCACMHVRACVCMRTCMSEYSFASPCFTHPHKLVAETPPPPSPRHHSRDNNPFSSQMCLSRRGLYRPLVDRVCLYVHASAASPTHLNI